MNLFLLQPSAPPATPGGGFNLPDPPAKAPPGLEDFGDFIIGAAKWAGGISCVVGVVLCVIMMALGRRNRSDMAANGALGIPWVFVSALILGGAVSMILGVVNSG